MRVILTIKFYQPSISGDKFMLKLKKTVLVITALYVFAGAKAGFASETYKYPVLNDYSDLGQKLVTQTESAQSPADLEAIRNGAADLIKLGLEIQRLYGEKNPKCVEQFKAFDAALPDMENLSIDEVEKKFHNGTALPSAPKHCYFGRSEIIHPVMNIIRLKGTWSSEVKEQVVEDFQEVVEHLARIQKNLDNPPNL